ncbi:MAG: class I SAM-dependent methyltransferase [Mariniblastus sp.]|nr:class I SAM-dependent methyltransferase [Mariniblastus sp.]
MSLERVREPEVMDTSQEAEDYNAMDHSEVNRVFVSDLLHFANAHEKPLGDVLDLGTGTALIPIELCQRESDCRVMAIDMSINMLELARYNIEADGLIERIELAQVDAKQMAFSDGMFSSVMSNSIIHHIPEPADCVSEMVRVTASGGILYVRDLLRPETDAQVEHLVQTYAGQENDHSRQMFDDSLRAALSIDEIRELVVQNGFDAEDVQATTDRHWTWASIQS